MWKKLRKWFCSATGIVSLTLIIVSSIMFIVNGCEKNWEIDISSIVIGLIINLLTIIITINFVDFLFRRQNLRELKRQEKEKIIRANKLLMIHINSFRKYFNRITTPIQTDTNSHFVESDMSKFNTDFTIGDMRDMFFNSLDGGLYETAIQRYYKKKNY